METRDDKETINRHVHEDRRSVAVTAANGDDTIFSSHGQQDVLKQIHVQVKQLAAEIERVQIADYVLLMNSPRKLLVSNLWAGIARGVGYAIGFTLFTWFILYFLKLLGALNLPIIGDFVADIVHHVQFQLEGRRY